MTRRSGKTANQVERLEQMLAAMTDEGLLNAFAALTHRLHAADRKKGADLLALSIRSQRDHVKDEILRRMEPR